MHSCQYINIFVNIFHFTVIYTQRQTKIGMLKSSRRTRKQFNIGLMEPKSTYKNNEKGNPAIQLCGNLKFKSGATQTVFVVIKSFTDILLKQRTFNI